MATSACERKGRARGWQVERLEDHRCGRGQQVEFMPGLAGLSAGPAWRPRLAIARPKPGGSPAGHGGDSPAGRIAPHAIICALVASAGAWSHLEAAHAQV